MELGAELPAARTGQGSVRARSVSVSVSVVWASLTLRTLLPDSDFAAGAEMRKSRRRRL